MTSLEADPRVETLLKDATVRRTSGMPARERRVEASLALLLVVAAALLAWRLPTDRSPSIGLLASIVVAYAAAAAVPFRMGAGRLMLTQPVLVVALLLLPPALAIAVVVVASLLVRAPAYVRGGEHPDRVLVPFGNAWHAVGPAIVIGAFAPGPPQLDHWPVYLLALVAQIVFDSVSGVARDWLSFSVPPSLQLRLLASVYAVDAALAPVGLLAALATAHAPVAALFVVPLIGIFNVLGRERERRIDHAIALGHAYRGTALLMGEMLEADDPYTGGEHSKGVVALALSVGEELGLDELAQRELEFSSLLHDIGKLRVPDEILNKPGPLTDAEWDVMRRHPADGQAMLDRIGGMLADVGVVVRAHHERWDGGGYPDGLAGEEIPLAARIIAVCDAYSAMTTDRPYRSAMPVAAALVELRKCQGTQFDTQVVDALVNVVRLETPQRLSTTLTLAA